MEDQLISIGDFARPLGVHVNTVRNWSDKGLIDCLILPTGTRRYYLKDLERLLARSIDLKASA